MADTQANVWGLKHWTKNAAFSELSGGRWEVKGGWRETNLHCKRLDRQEVQKQWWAMMAGDLFLIYQVQFCLCQPTKTIDRTGWEEKKQHWNLSIINLHFRMVKIWRKKKTIRNKCQKSTLPSHSHGLKTFVVHTLFWHKRFFLTLLFLSFCWGH